MIQNTRPVMADQSYKSSPFYKGHDGLVSRLEEALSWDEAAEKLQREAQVKAGKADKDAYRGISERDTEITRRITNQTFQPTNDSAYRTQLVIEQRLKNQIAQAKEDLAREKANMAHIKEALNYY